MTHDDHADSGPPGGSKELMEVLRNLTGLAGSLVNLAGWGAKRAAEAFGKRLDDFSSEFEKALSGLPDVGENRDLDRHRRLAVEAHTKARQERDSLRKLPAEARSGEQGDRHLGEAALQMHSVQQSLKGVQMSVASSGTAVHQQAAVRSQGFLEAPPTPSSPAPSQGQRHLQKAAVSNSR